MPDRPPFATMTTNQLRDWLAVNVLGWKRVGERWKHPVWHKSGNGQKRHPIPNTIDGAKAAMPEKTCWTREWAEHPDFTKREIGLVLVWIATPGESVVRLADTADEIHDRFRLACECVWAEKNATTSQDHKS